MSEPTFSEDDARLAAMHGYEPATKADVARIEDRLERIEKALKAGAVGNWTQAEVLR